MANINSFEELEVWKKEVEFCQLIYNEINTASLNKDFVLGDQLRKFAISILQILPGNSKEKVMINSSIS